MEETVKVDQVNIAGRDIDEDIPARQVPVTASMGLQQLNQSRQVPAEIEPLRWLQDKPAAANIVCQARPIDTFDPRHQDGSIQPPVQVLAMVATPSLLERTDGEDLPFCAAHESRLSG
jgi:hypothetical protein